MSATVRPQATRLRQQSRSHPPMPLILGGLVALVFLAGYLLGKDRQLLTIAIFFIPPVLVIALRTFDQVVLAIPASALLIPYSLPTGTESRVPIVMLLVMLLSGIWILAALVQGRGQLLHSPLNAPLICFVVICVLSFVWSVAFRDPLLITYGKFTFVQLGALAAMVLSPLATLLVANFIRTPQRLWIVAGPFLVLGIVATVTYFVGINLANLNTRGLFPLWFVALGYAILLVQPNIPLIGRLALGLVLAAYGYIVGFVSISWLSGWVPPLVAIMAITLIRSWRGFLVLVALLALMIAWQQDFLYKTIYEDSEKEGDFQRLTLWQLNLELLENHPILGTGPAGYALYYITYHPQEARSTHNNYLDLIAQTGVLGSVCWLWLVLAGLREGWIVMRHAPPGTYRTLGLAACGGLVGAMAAMALGDWVLPFAYNQGIEGYRFTVFSWIFLGVLMSIRQQLTQRVAQEHGHG